MREEERKDTGRGERKQRMERRREEGAKKRGRREENK